VGRILMNLHLDILAQAALLPRPGAYRKLRDIAGLIEERMAVLTERQRSDTGLTSPQRVEKGSRLCGVEQLLLVSSQPRKGLSVSIVGSRGIFRGIVGNVIPRVL
jgi:hypothetical protein